MLLVRKEQWNAFKQDRLNAFHKTVTDCAKAACYEKIKGLSRDEVRDLIDYAVTRAESYQITAAEGICKFVQLIVSYGRDFDTNPDLPFADRILHERMVYEREPTIDRLYELQNSDAAGR